MPGVSGGPDGDECEKSLLAAEALPPLASGCGRSQVRDAVLAEVGADVVALHAALTRHFTDVALAAARETREVLALEGGDGRPLRLAERGAAAGTARPVGRGVAPETMGFYINSPFFQSMEGFASQKVSVVARYPNAKVNASGWIRGDDLMYGRAAVVAIEMNPGKVVLFGIRPQHRAQTHATFPLLFNALYWSAEGDLSNASTPPSRTNQ